MIDLKRFRKENKLKQSEVADYLGISSQFISAFETGRAKLPETYIEKLLNNDCGWVTVGLTESGNNEVGQFGGGKISILESINTRFEEQNKQIDRLLTIVERLTTEKK